MAKGHCFTKGGKVFKVSAKEAKRLLKACIKGQDPIPRDGDEIGPFFDLDNFDADQAGQLYLKIDIGPDAVGQAEAE
jgi:hypothetical protein